MNYKEQSVFRRLYRSAIREWDYLPATLSIGMVAMLLGCDTHEIARLSCGGQIPGARKIGNRWFYDKRILQKFFEGTTDDERN